MARKRRGHGEGGVYQRASDGRWVGSITTGRTSGGRQKRRVVYGTTKAEVLTRLRAIQKQHDAGTLSDPSTLTVEGYLRRWMDTVGKTKRGTTQERRRIYIEQHINPFLGGVRLNKLALVHLESWLTSLEQAGRSTWTIHQAATTLGTALRRAVTMKLIPFNPAAELIKPQPKPKEVEVYTEKQVKQLLASSVDHRLHALYVLALTSGMREGELLALHWTEVDFEHETVTVVRTLSLSQEVDSPWSRRSRRGVVARSTCPGSP